MIFFDGLQIPPTSTACAEMGALRHHQIHCAIVCRVTVASACCHNGLEEPIVVVVSSLGESDRSKRIDFFPPPCASVCLQLKNKLNMALSFQLSLQTWSTNGTLGIKTMITNTTRDEMLGTLFFVCFMMRTCKNPSFSHRRRPDAVRRPLQPVSIQMVRGNSHHKSGKNSPFIMDSPASISDCF